MNKEIKKTWTRQAVEILLDTNAKAVEILILHLFDRQTQVEKSVESTRVLNYTGFCAHDAKILTSFAKQIKRGYRLTTNQLVICRKRNRCGQHRLGKYYRQICELIEAKEATKAGQTA